MTPQIQNWIIKAKNKFIETPGKVLEIGSLDVNGGVRQYFQDASEYIGIDNEMGLGVDKVVNAHDIIKVWKPNSFDIVLCLEMLEHDEAPWVTIELIHKILKKNGFLLISTPTFGFPLHRYPKDYFRYGEDAYRDFFFKDFKILQLDEVIDIKNSPGICCIGQKK